MAMFRLSEEENARHWSANFQALLAAVRVRYVEKDERKAQVAALRGAALMAAWETASNGADAALRAIDPATANPEGDEHG